MNNIVQSEYREMTREKKQHEYFILEQHTHPNVRSVAITTKITDISSVESQLDLIQSY